MIILIINLKKLVCYTRQTYGHLFSIDTVKTVLESLKK